MPSDRPGAAGMAAAAACFCLAAVVLIGRGGTGVALGQQALFVWTPHQGKLTSMMLNAHTPAASAREQQLAAADAITSAQRATRGTPAGGSDQAWAQQMLRLGGSYAEDTSRTNLVTSDYSNTHPGFTPMVPETRQGRGVYAFANLISHGATSREDKQVGAARTQQLAQTSAPTVGAARTQQLAEAATSPGSTPDVREDRARPATKAWGWASRSAHGAHGTKLASTGMHIAGESAAVSEAADTHEQKAWSWASSAFHHGSRDSAPKAAPAPAKHVQKQARLADFAMPNKKTGSKEESPRQARLAEARKAIVKLHRASLNFEHRHFTKARRQEDRRARALAHKDDDLERAANQGAAAEFNEYGTIASLGVPRGAESAGKSERDGWGRRYRHERTAAQDAQARAGMCSQ